MLHHLRLIVSVSSIGTLVLAQTITFNLPLPRNSALRIPANEKLKFLTVGTGVQLYKCNSSALVWTNFAAEATLLDASQDKDPESLPERLMKGGSNTATRPMGRHFFTKDAKPVPVFEINGQQIMEAKVASTKSPGKPERNINWLQLRTISGSFAKSVFRTATRGGQLSGKCTSADVKQPPKQVKYAALYSFFA